MDRDWPASAERCRCTLAAAMLVLGVFIASAAGGEPPNPPADCWGVYSWCSWRPKTVTRETAPHVVGVPIVLHWKSVEPADGQFEFDEQLGAKLKLAKANGFYVFTMIWVGPASPAWIYDKGVPRVRTDGKDWTFPYYLDERYGRYFHRLIREYGKYVRSLPPDLLERIVFVQVCEGSTGDGYCYKGAPLDKKYAISRERWGKYRLRTWDLFKEVFQDGDKPAVRLLVNDDANHGEEHDWLLKNQNVIGCKQGMFSHGYHISDARGRLERWREFVAEAAEAGKKTFTRGEMDAEWKTSGWSRKNLRQSLYWSSLYATHCGLDLWNVPSEGCVGRTYEAALGFFNRYAGRRDPATAPAAFCALRRGLDASDTETFPEGRFGKASKSNIDRYVKIAAAFAACGAKQGDPPAAIKGGMVNRRREDYNDVGWGILRGNYGRFLQQIDPEQTSAAWWHAGPKDHHFSRFARGFEKAADKTAMYFRLDEGFFAAEDRPQAVELRVAYLDKGKGHWALCYHNGQDRADAISIQCADTGQWRERSVVVKDAHFNRRLPNLADLMLQHRGGDDTVFHMVEVLRR